jgi:D-Tyr-tRNAtyr deacylase
MKKTLLISSALASGIIYSGSALAQTTVSGSLDLHYKALSLDGTSAGSTRGIGRESQVNVQSKGKLNNGMDYAAGFSLEFDGQNGSPALGTNSNASSTETNTISNENVFIDIIMGSTTLTMGIDHIQNSTNHSAPFIRNVLDDVAAGAAGMSATDQIGAKTKEAMAIGIVQNIPGTGINLSALYAPQGGSLGGSDQNPGNGNRNASYEIGFVGTDPFGVKGAKIHYFKNKEDKSTAVVADVEGTTYGVGYNFGQFALGVDVHKMNRSDATGTADADMKNTMYSATFAATKDITLGVVYNKNDINGTAADEKIKAVQVGYNLGPVVITAEYADIENIDGVTTANISQGNQGSVRLSTKF